MLITFYKITDKNENTKIGITFSAFDLLHAGHIKMLEEAKTVCDYLIVGLQLDQRLTDPTKINLHKVL